MSNDLSQATMNMVKNTISANKDCHQHETNGFYLKKEDESIYMLFGNKRMDVFHNGEHLKGIEAEKPKDMKEAMAMAADTIKEVKGILNNIVESKKENTKDLKQAEKEIHNGMEM